MRSWLSPYGLAAGKGRTGAASEGYLAAAPDLSYWGSRLRCLWTIMREVTAGYGRTAADIDAARDWLSG